MRVVVFLFIFLSFHFSYFIHILFECSRWNQQQHNNLAKIWKHSSKDNKRKRRETLEVNTIFFLIKMCTPKDGLKAKRTSFQNLRNCIRNPPINWSLVEPQSPSVHHTYSVWMTQMFIFNTFLVNFYDYFYIISTLTHVSWNFFCFGSTLLAIMYSVEYRYKNSQ